MREQVPLIPENTHFDCVIINLTAKLAIVSPVLSLIDGIPPLWREPRAVIRNLPPHENPVDGTAMISELILLPWKAQIMESSNLGLRCPRKPNNFLTHGKLTNTSTLPCEGGEPIGHRSTPACTIIQALNGPVQGQLKSTHILQSGSKPPKFEL